MAVGKQLVTLVSSKGGLLRGWFLHLYQSWELNSSPAHRGRMITEGATLIYTVVM